MNEQDLKVAISNTKAFKGFEGFKQSITMKRSNILHLHDLYCQADRLGIAYLKQNPNIMSSDFKIIEELILNKHAS